MAIEEVLKRLVDVRGAGNRWRARCPAHDDRAPSLSIAEGRDGRALLHCFAGCAVEKIVAAVGLTMRDLFPSKARRAGLRQRRSYDR